jgi:hypothetical protein
MIEKREPMTWDSEGRLVPATEAELARQSKDMSDVLATRVAAPQPEAWTPEQIRLDKWQRFTRNCRQIVSFRWGGFDDNGSLLLLGPRMLILVIVCAVMLLPFAILLYIGAATGMIIGEAKVRRLNRESTS